MQTRTFKNPRRENEPLYLYRLLIPPRQPGSLHGRPTTSIVNPLIRLRTIILVGSIEHRALVGTSRIEETKLIVHAL